MSAILNEKYKVIRTLGKGGFGETFLAQDNNNNLCVVKHLKPQFKGDSLLSLAKRLFLKEVEILDRLGTHPQIPQLVDHFAQDEDFYLVQEFVDGSELSEELGRIWRETEVIAFLKEILEILSFVHEAKVIHRDIKPSNIMRRKTDNKLVLIDFGAVKEITTIVMNSDGKTSLTAAVGTLGYMPSEQQSGRPKFCSDLYAVAIICIEALTGVNASQLLDDPATGEIMWHHHLRQPISPLLKSILDRMVRYDFRERYQSCRAILEALSFVNQPYYSQPRTTVPKTTFIYQKKPLPWELSIVIAFLMGFFGLGIHFSTNRSVLETKQTVRQTSLPPDQEQPETSVSSAEKRSVSSIKKEQPATSVSSAEKRSVSSIKKEQPETSVSSAEKRSVSSIKKEQPATSVSSAEKRSVSSIKKEQPIQENKELAVVAPPDPPPLIKNNPLPNDSSPIQIANQLAEQGNFRAAMEILDRNRQLENQVAFWITRADIQIKIGHYRPARQGLIRALALEPNSPLVLEMLSQLDTLELNSPPPKPPRPSRPGYRI